MAIDFGSIQADVNKMMKEGNLKKAGKVLGETLKYVDESMYERYCQILRGVLDIDMDGFMEKGYPAMIMKGRKVPPEKWMEMEMVFLDKHVLVPGEQIASAFPGAIGDNWAVYSGRIYLTNVRLISCGFKLLRAIGNSLVGLIVVEVIRSIRNSVTKAIQQTLAAQAAVNVVTLGYMFPIHGCYDIMRGDRNISYKNDISYEKGDKIKTETMRVTITPGRFQSVEKQHFKDVERPAILNNVNALLYQMSGIQSAHEKINTPSVTLIPSGRFCPACSAPITSNAIFCGKCGRKIDEKGDFI